ncbi:hypothetical protein P691DRAFT_666174, partial [Macrolepiota fuliginosa MF-IS2]
GSCGWQNTEVDLVVALKPANFGNKAACRRNIRVNCEEIIDQGKSVNVEVANLCPGCGPGRMDLFPAAFQQLADLSVG